MNEISLASSISAFRTLALAADATAEAIVERETELSGRNPAEAESFRRAREQLLTHARGRLRHELIEVPGATYGKDPWESFCKKFERNPVGLARFVKDTRLPSSPDFDWVAFLSLAIDERVSASTADLAPAIKQPPFPPGIGPPPLEIYDVIFG